MTIQTAHAIIAASADLGEDARLVESYSGRGMMGRTTAGVVVPSVAAAIAAVAAAVADADEPEQMAADLRRVEWDTLGRQIIIY
jgi:hypothetical protein